MFFHRFRCLLATVLCLAGCCGMRGAETPPPTAPASVDALENAGEQTWREIKDYPFAQRAGFIAGLDKLEVQAGQLTAGLKARRPLTGDPKDWDDGMKRLNTAYAYFTSVCADMAKATSVNWAERTERVSGAWDRFLEAYEKLKALTPA